MRYSSSCDSARAHSLSFPKHNTCTNAQTHTQGWKVHSSRHDTPLKISIYDVIISWISEICVYAPALYTVSTFLRDLLTSSCNFMMHFIRFAHISRDFTNTWEPFIMLSRIILKIWKQLTTESIVWHSRKNVSFLLINDFCSGDLFFALCGVEKVSSRESKGNKL